MKMVKSLLLGSAAGLAAVTGAQAADMPVKARPVEYVRICSLYGEGFFYIPGTDTCLKLGGYVRFQAEYGAGGGGIVDGSFQLAGQGRFTRDLENDVNYRVRGVTSWDVRQQTEYGTLRTYIRFGVENTTPGATGGGTTATAFWDRAFLQFVGFTVGRAQSFFDVWTHGGAYNYNNVRTSGDTGASGQNLWAYTAQFGNGLSGSISLEDPATRKFPVYDQTCGPFTPTNALAPQDNAFALNGVPCGVAAGHFGFRVPDIIGNLRVDQAWGWAGVSAALHDVSGAYWLTPNNVNNGHPADKYGWAVAVGAQFNVGTGAGGIPADTWGFQATYSEGAVGFVTNSAWWQVYKNSNQVGYAQAVDGIFGGPLGTEVQLTRAWNINAGYQHWWSRKWRTSWYGGYVVIDYNQTATNLVCAAGTLGGAGSFFAPASPSAVAAGGVHPQFNCNPDFSFFQVGSRTQWNPVPQLDIGLDVMYTKLNTAFKGVANLAGNGSRPVCINALAGNGGCAVDDQGVWSAMFRWQRNFFP
jgi:hypothetical protein